MIQVARTNNSQVSFVIAKTNYTLLYNQLTKILPADLHVIFAKPTVGEFHTIWTAESAPESANVRSFELLSEEEKNRAADFIDERKAQIMDILQGNATFAPLVENLFLISDSNDIKLVEYGHDYVAVLTQWGCKSAQTKTAINPLTTALDRPGNNRSPVTIKISYRNGDFVSDSPFYVDYKGGTKVYKTDEQGLCSLGKFIHGSELKAYLIVDGQRRYVHSFNITAQTLYPMQIPYLTDAILTVVNQDDEPLANVAVKITHLGQSFDYQSSENGTVALPNLEAGENIVAAATINEGGKTISGEAQFDIERSDNHFTLRLQQPKPANLTIKVLDQNDQALPGLPLGVGLKNQMVDYVTDANGVVELKGLYEIGQTVQLFTSEYGGASQSVLLSERDNVLVFKIALPEPKWTRVKLVDRKNNPLPGIPMNFTYKGGNAAKTTDTEAACLFPLGTFSHKEKVKVEVRYPQKDKKGNIKTKIYRKSFRYDENQQEYIIKLSRRNWWWLLLLLLLLLLIQCERKVPVKVIDADTMQPLAAADVAFEYQRQNLFRPWGFFTSDSTRFDQKTDSFGVARFEHLRYSLYSLVFYNWMKAQVSAQCNCYAPDTIRPYFHYMDDTLVLKMRAAMQPLDFVVIDSFDGEPLPDAKVVVDAEFGGRVYRDTAISDPSGRVLMDRIPQCAKNINIRASKEGYYPDSIMHKTVPDLSGDIDKRTLKLIPMTAKITFFVVDCKTGKPIPGATAIIDVDGKARKQRGRTNINGVGKGEYDEARLSETVEIIAGHPSYRTGRLPRYKVRDFIKLPDSLRTICLEPMPAPCNTQHKSGGAGVTINEYNMMDPNMKFTILYDMYTIKDRMIVYCGRQSSPGKVLHDTGFLSGTGSLPVDLKDCGDTWITIKVIGPNGTDWKYEIDCIGGGGGGLGDEFGDNADYIDVVN